MAERVDLATCSYPEFTADMGIPVRCSLGYPRYRLSYTIEARLPELTPKADYLTASLEVYNRRFFGQLNEVGTMGFEKLFDRLRERYGTGDPEDPANRLVFLCFEQLGDRKKDGRLNKSRGDGCHRRGFASWWERETGQQIPEFGALPSKVPPDDAAEGALF
jgi:hypothetical protein